MHAFAKSMIAVSAAFLAPVLGISPTTAAEARFSSAGQIPLGAAVHWDLLQVEPRSHRVFITHDEEVTVVDGAKAEVVGHVASGGVSHGIAFTPQYNLGWTDDSLTATAIAFDLTTLQVVARLPTAPGPDVVIYNPKSNLILVLDGKGHALTIIDPGQRTVAATLNLQGQPESAVIDKDGSVFIQLTDTQEIIHLDAAARHILARHSITDCAKPRGLAFDAETRRLFSSCLNQRLIVSDAESGRIVASPPIGRGTDTAVFDLRSRRIFSPNGDGELSIIQEVDAENFTALAALPTLPGARTMAMDPMTGRIFLPSARVQARGETDQYGRVHLTFKPKSTLLMVFDPQP